MKTCHHTSDLIAKVTSHLHWHWSQINQPPKEAWILKFTVHLVICKCQNYVLYKYQPSSGQSSSLLMKTSCLRLKLVELNFFASFTTDNQSTFNISNKCMWKGWGRRKRSKLEYEKQYGFDKVLYISSSKDI